jgi:hypothetical protein
MAGAGLSGAGTLIGNILAGSFRQAYCPAEILGRTVAGMRFLGFGMIPLGALTAGAPGTAFGVRTARWIVLGGYALSGLILLALPVTRGEAPPPVMARARERQRTLSS